MTTPKISGAEYLARALDAYGVTAAFFVPTILSRTLYEMEARTGIRRILTHGEKASVYMADGYARATGRPGAVHRGVEGDSGEGVEDTETDAAIPAPEPVTVPRLRTRPTAESVAAAAAMLRAARRPVIVAGGGVRASGAGAELRALAERLN